MALPHPKSRRNLAPWHTQIAAFFLYPANPVVLPAIVALTLCTMIAGWLSIVGLILAVAVTLTGYKFAFEILQHHADGWEEPPEAMLTVRNGLVFQYLIVLFIGGIIHWCVQTFFGPVASAALLAIFSLMQPGYTMVAVIERSAISALNPAKWIRLIQVFGNGYLLLSLLLFGSYLLDVWLANHVFQLLPGMIASAVVKIIGLWTLFTSAYWMGYLIYQYHRELGYQPNAHIDQAIRGLDRDDMLIQAIDAAIVNQTYDNCIERVTNESRERVLSIPAHAKYRELLIKNGDITQIRQHAQSFLHQLLTEKNLPRAMSLTIQQFSIDPDFSPLDGEAADALTKEARRVGQTGIEIKLLTRLLETFPNETITGDWAVRLSELLMQSGEPATKAIELLEAAHAATRSESQRERLTAAKLVIANR